MTDQTKKKPATRRPRRMAREPGTNNADKSGATPANTSARRKTKASLVEDLLTSDDGTTLDAMCVTTGWLPHTCRAFLTSLRKKGKAIDRERREDGASVYRLVEPETVADPHARAKEAAA